MKNFGDYVYFYYVGNNAGYSFRNYTDPETGLEVGYVIGFDKNKQPILKNWEFDNGQKRQIRLHVNEKDKEGKSAVDFLRRSPECYQSPNGKYIPTETKENKQVAYLFKEINETADATAAVSTRSLVIEAQAKALKLKGEELKEMALIIGVDSPNEAIQTHRVLDYASNWPLKFNDLLVDPARKIKAFVKKGIKDGVLKQEGRIIKWEEKIIGSDEDEAISVLLKDKALFDAIKLHLQKFGS